MSGATPPGPSARTRALERGPRSDVYSASMSNDLPSARSCPRPELPLPAADLKVVQKPAQYLGGERGAVHKDEGTVTLRMCLAFPDTYEVGMSHIGMQILYDMLNRRPD